jgi:hypothetical protein
MEDLSGHDAGRTRIVSRSYLAMAPEFGERHFAGHAERSSRPDQSEGNKGGEMMDTERRCQLACWIIQNTRDGNDLEPADLQLVENAVNGFLNEEGYKAFEALHDKVVSGEYLKPWLCGVENITRDHEGYIYWKGKHVDHYTFNAFKSWDEVRESLEELAGRCRYLESINVEPSAMTTCWQWEKYLPGPQLIAA